MENIKCPCGKGLLSECKTPGGYRRVDVERETGYHGVSTWDGDIIWLCDDCFSKARVLARDLFLILKNENIFMHDLMRED